MVDLPNLLRNGDQLDEEGVMCAVSRQACHEAADRIEELEAALQDVRNEICRGPTRDTLWHCGIPAETTVDFICRTLGDEWPYDGWVADNA